jgi:hypothetical protein
MKALTNALFSAAALTLLASGHAVGGPHGGAPPSAVMPHAATAPPSLGANAMTSGKSTMHTPVAKGQPNQSCGSASAPETPGHAASAPGSAFNPDGNAGTHYAGQQPQNSRNPASVAQYDVACSNQK